MKKYLLPVAIAAISISSSLSIQGAVAAETGPAVNKSVVAPEIVAKKYIIEPNHTSVSWSANHMGFSNVTGKFTDISGEIVFDEKKPESSSVNVAIKTSGISTGLSNFDEHMKSADLLNVKKFPTAQFVSKKIILDNNPKTKMLKRATIEGELTLLGVTKPVTLNAKFNKIAPNPMNQKETVGFSANGVIKRSDFGINYALPAVPDSVALTIEVEANR